MSQIRMFKAAPEAIANKWHAFRGEIESALPPLSVESPDRMNNVLEALLTGVLECYLVYSENEDGSKNLLAILTLTTGYQLDSTHKDLIFYTLTGTANSFSPEEWAQGVELVKSIGRSKGCARTVLYSNDLGVLRLLERLGADTSYRVVTFDNKEV